MTRECCVCHREITACFGSVKAGDLLEHIDGARAAAAIRELCGQCTMRLMLIEEAAQESIIGVAQ